MDFDFGNVPSRAHELFHKLETQGVTYVEGLVEAQKSEELFLDYKRISTSSDAKSLNDTDRANLRKALSGFSNSEGGVILWGLETAKNNGVEVPRRPEGSDNPARFASLIEDAVSGCTVPPVPGVRSIVIPTNSDATKGLVATLIPSSLIAPHQTTDDGRAYFMRAGSSFQRVPHGVLAGMFGRRPSPRVEIHQRVTGCYVKKTLQQNQPTVEVALELENLSSVVARNAYISWKATELCSANSRLLPRLVPEAKWDLTKSDYRNGSVLAEESYRLSPYSRTPILTLELQISESINESLDIEIYFGCESSPPKSLRFFCSKDTILSAIDDLKAKVAGEHKFLGTDISIGSRIFNLTSTSC